MKLLLFLLGFFCFCEKPFAETLRVVTEDLPPYQVVEDGKLVGGYSFFLVQELLKRADINVHIEVLPWARAFKVASTQENVVIFSIARNKKREALFNWLLKLKDLTYHFYSLPLQPHLAADNLTELLTHSVVAVRSSYEANSLMAHGFVEGKNLILTTTYNEAWQIILKRRADYIYSNELLQNSIHPVLLASPSLSQQSFDLGETSDLYLATSTQFSPYLLQKLQANIVAMQQDGTLAQFLANFEQAPIR